MQLTPKGEKKRDPLKRVSFLCFATYFCIFFAEKFAYVKKKQYLCTRNRKGIDINYHRPKRIGQRRGATREE